MLVADVLGSIDVRVVLVSASHTAIDALVTRTLVHITTIIAALRCEVGINLDHFDALGLALVAEHELQLCESPLPHPFAHGLATALIADTSQVFHDVGAHIRVAGEFLRDDMIDVASEPLFPAGHGAQAPLGRPGAFALQCRSIVLEPPSGCSNLGTCVFTSFGGDSNLVDPTVDTNDRAPTMLRCWQPEHHLGVDIALAGDVQRHGVDGCLRVALGEPLWNHDQGADSLVPHACGNGQEVAPEREQSKVHGDRLAPALRIELPLALGVVGVPRLHGSCPSAQCNGGELGQHRRIVLTDDVVHVLLESGLIGRLMLSTPVHDHAPHEVVLSDDATKNINLLLSKRDGDRDGPCHVLHSINDT